jgi:glycosyltransferase involved in cell wall biosynthesis
MSFINLAEHLFKKTNSIQDCQIVFVSDSFVDEYVGGAELSSEALLTSSPFSVFRLKSSDVSMEILEKGYQKYWIFGNYANLKKELIPTICTNMRYSVIEFDYKYCKYRSAEKHNTIEQSPCDCSNDINGKLVSAFMYAAKSLWWMSEKQQDTYEKLFPFLKQKNSTVLSSVFDDATFALLKVYKQKYSQAKDDKWIVCGSPSWIKGTDNAVQWCKDNNKNYEVVWNVPYEQMLEKFAKSEGFVFLPNGADTCPRQVIEAKLLGCKLHLNDNVQHKDEIWFNTDDMFDTEAYLYMCRDRFWNSIKVDMEYRPTLSGYTTVKDCIRQDYPFKECIQSMLGFCDEVVVVDGGSDDGTWEELQTIAEADNRVVIHQQKRNWEHPRFAVFDGAQKALARSLCSGDFCWQQDSDEVVNEEDQKKIKELIRHIPSGVALVALPVVEYWGSTEKVRLDINVSKWRLSRNLPHITHGIPAHLRKFDENGELYSAQGSDGCDYIRSDNYTPIPFANFIMPDAEKLRYDAVFDADAKNTFETWYDDVVKKLPVVHHFSWFNIERKIKTYKGYWQKHWCSLYDIKLDDIAENNMFFQKPWRDVSNEEISAMSKKLASLMGGWIFHRPVDFSKKTNYMKISSALPANMSEWISRNTNV